MHMPGTRERVAGIDSAWLRMDDVDNLMVVTLVMAFERPVTYDWIRRLVETRLLELPRFRQRIVNGFWEEDPHFDVDRHLQEWHLDDPSDDTSLHRFVSAAMSEPLDPSRPLWRFYFVPQYGSGSALVTRIHHCIGDGLALIYTFLSMADDSASHAVPGCGRPIDRAASWREVLGRAAVGTATLGKLLLMSRDRPTALKGPLTVEKRATWSKPVPLDRVKAASRLMDASINDVLLTAVTGGLHQYLVSRGGVDDDLVIRGIVPVNLRRREDAHLLGNRFGLVFLTMPVGLGSRAERLAEIGRRMNALKRSLEPYVTFQILRILGILAPRWFFDLFIRMFGRKATAVVTNVVGPRDPIAFGGVRLSQAMFWVPCAGKLGLGVSVLSYAGHVSVGFASDAALVPDPETIVKYFDAELGRLLECVTPQPIEEYSLV